MSLTFALIGLSLLNFLLIIRVMWKLISIEHFLDKLDSEAYKNRMYSSNTHNKLKTEIREIKDHVTKTDRLVERLFRLVKQREERLRSLSKGDTTSEGKREETDSGK